MSEQNNKENSKLKHDDIFIVNSIYPEVDSIFKVNRSLEDIKDDCYIVLDTNVLLLPYKTGKKSVSLIKQTYQKLITESRLFVPAQVAREFVKNRPEQLIQLHQSLKKKRDKSFKEGTYPLLESLNEYQELLEIEKVLEDKLKEYREKIDKLLKSVQNWTWNDPISLIYADLFNKDVIFSIDINEEEIKQDLEKRKVYSIPPGYKDSSKPDSGVGDLMIWKTILEIGKKYKKSVIFVSGEKKSDWWHTSANSALYPRYELVDEFRRYSEGQSFHLIELSHLLELYGANETVINEIKQEEKEITVRILGSDKYNSHFNQTFYPRLTQQKNSPREQRLRYLKHFIDTNIAIAETNIKICNSSIHTPELETIGQLNYFETQIESILLDVINNYVGLKSREKLLHLIDCLKMANSSIEVILNNFVDGFNESKLTIEELISRLIEIRLFTSKFRSEISKWIDLNLNF